MRPGRTFAPIVGTLALTTIIAGCGGGGGGGATSSTSPVTATPAPVAQVPVQRTDAAQTLQMLRVLQISGSLGAPMLTGLSVERRTAGALRLQSGALRLAASTPACNNGSEVSSVTNPNGSSTVVADTFYDSTCQTPEQSFAWTPTLTGSTLAGPATLTKYAQTGSVLSYETSTLSVTFTDTTFAQPSQIAINASVATAVGGPSIGALDLSCTIAGPGMSGASCGMGTLADLSSLSEEFGATMTISGSQNLTGGNTLQASVSAQAYQGSLNGLTLAAGSFPAWTISGGNQIDTASAVVVASYSTGGGASSLSFTMTDAQDGATVTLAVAPTGYAGTITQTSNGATIATFTIDPLGDGTITYSDGTQGQIVDYILIS